MNDYLPYCIAALFFILELISWHVWKSTTHKPQSIAESIAMVCEWITALILAVSLPASWSSWIRLPYASLWWTLLLFIIVSLLSVLIISTGMKKPLNESFVHAYTALFGFLFFWMPETKEETPEEFEHLTEGISEHEDQLEVIENAMDLGETTLGEICTHRSDMVQLSMKDDPAKWKQTILANRHTFYPLTNESEDDVIGILDTRDYFRMPGFGKKQILDHCVDKPLFAAENTTADELLHIMKNRKTYIAIVLDEYGGVVGLVTLHDIIEELFGELSEEEEKRQADIVKLPKGLWRISGEANLKDVSKALDTHLELDDFETFSGYVIGTMGYIPEDGTQLEVQIGNLMIQIKRIAGHRIRQALVHKIVPDPTAKEKEAK